jgi:hypothetical protein
MYKIKSVALLALVILFGGAFIKAEAQKGSMAPIFIGPPPFIEAALSGSYSVVVNANQLSAGEVEPTTGATYGWTCYGSTEGDLSGFLFVSMNYASDYPLSAEAFTRSFSSVAVTGGSWSKLIFVNGVYAGSVYGKIVSGQLVRDKTQGTTSLNLELTSDEGTGDYVGSVGSGTFEGVLDQNSKVPSVSGKLVLKY